MVPRKISRLSWHKALGRCEESPRASGARLRALGGPFTGALGVARGAIANIARVPHIRNEQFNRRLSAKDARVDTCVCVG